MYFLRHKLCEGEEVNTHYTPLGVICKRESKKITQIHLQINNAMHYLSYHNGNKNVNERKKEAKVCEIRRY